MRRFRMVSWKHGILIEHTLKSELVAIRKKDPRFKGYHIKDIIQAIPSAVKVGKVYNIKFNFQTH